MEGFGEWGQLPHGAEGQYAAGGLFPGPSSHVEVGWLGAKPILKTW